MIWLLPSALAIAGVAALVTIALHFIARSRPLAEPLPTARFIPARPIRARTRSTALSDLLLLLIRAVALMILGVAAAGPVLARHRGGVARIIAVDRSRDVASIDELRDSARAHVRPHDAVVLFDSAARITESSPLDSLRIVDAPGSLSAAFAAAIAAGARETTADSVELVVVSPLAAEEIDAATTAIRGAWPGRVRLVHVAPAASDTNFGPVQMQKSATDPVAAALELAHATLDPATAKVRLVRGHLSSEDSAWARGDGHVVVHWPFADTAASWAKRARIDAIGGVTSQGGTVVGRFPRLWTLSGRAVAYWADGEPAAVEHSVGGGCIRDVGVLLDPASDLTLRSPFREFMRSMFEPCGGSRNTTPIDTRTYSALAGRGALAVADALREHTEQASLWTPWLLGVAAILLIVELAMRRSKPAKP